MLLDKQKVENLIRALDLVAEADLAVAQQEAQEKKVAVWEVLIRKGLLSEKEWQILQTKLTGVPFLDLSQQTLSADVFTLIPEPLARCYEVMAFGRDDNYLKIALVDLTVLPHLDFLKKTVGLRIQPYLVDRLDLNKAILTYQKFLKEQYGLSLQQALLAFQTLPENLSEEFTQEQLLELLRSKQINRIFELLLRHALLQKVSHIHIEPQEDNVVIKYRLNGELYPAMILPKKSALVFALKIKALAGLPFTSQTFCDTGKFMFGFDGKEIDFQAYFIPTLWGERITLRLLRQGEAGFSLEATGFQGVALDVINRVLNQKKGLVLIVGEENTGRTTTFYTLLDLLKDPEISIGTLEKTIGFQMAGVNQTVINQKVGLNLTTGLTRLAQQDYDVIAIDQIEDLASIKFLENLYRPQIFQEDSLVLAVVKTTAQSIDEVLSKLIFSEKTKEIILEKGSLVILQKLLPALSSEKQEYYLTPADIKKLGRKINLDGVMQFLVEQNIVSAETPWSEIRFFKNFQPGAGSGSKIMVAEVFPLGFSFWKKIEPKKSLDKLKEQLTQEKFFSWQAEALIKAVQGFISIDEVLNIT